MAQSRGEMNEFIGRRAFMSFAPDGEDEMECQQYCDRCDNWNTGCR